MRIKNVKAAERIANKVTGNIYIVRNGIASQVDGNGEILEGGDVVDLNTLTENQLLCFNVVKFSKPTEVPTGYYVEDGILCRYGEPVTEQGELRLAGVVGNIIGQVILTTEPENGKVNLLRYLPNREIFQGLLYDLPELRALYETEDELILGGNVTEVGLSSLGYASFVRVTNTRASESKAWGMNIPADGKYNTIPTLGASGYITCNKLEAITDSDTGEIVDVAVSLEDEATVQIDTVNGNEAVILPFVAESATICRMANGAYRGRYIYKAENKVYAYSWTPEPEDEDYEVILETTKVAQLAGYDYLIDVTSGAESTKYTFANVAYETKTLDVKFVDGPVGKIVTVA